MCNYNFAFSKGSECFGYKSLQKTYPMIKKSFYSLQLHPKPDRNKISLTDSGQSTCRASTVYYVDGNGKNILWCNYDEEYFKVISTPNIPFSIKVYLHSLF